MLCDQLSDRFLHWSLEKEGEGGKIIQCSIEGLVLRASITGFDSMAAGQCGFPIQYPVRVDYRFVVTLS